MVNNQLSAIEQRLEQIAPGITTDIYEAIRYPEVDDDDPSHAVYHEVISIIDKQIIKRIKPPEA